MVATYLLRDTRTYSTTLIKRIVRYVRTIQRKLYICKTKRVMREEQYQPREVTIRKQVSEIVGYNGSRFMYDPNNKTIVEIKHKNKVKSMLK